MLAMFEVLEDRKLLALTVPYYAHSVDTNLGAMPVERAIAVEPAVDGVRRAVAATVTPAKKTRSSVSNVLSVSSNGRFLVQSNGQPFFYLADTAWRLFIDT